MLRALCVFVFLVLCAAPAWAVEVDAGDLATSAQMELCRGQAIVGKVQDTLEGPSILQSMCADNMEESYTDIARDVFSGPAIAEQNIPPAFKGFSSFMDVNSPGKILGGLLDLSGFLGADTCGVIATVQETCNCVGVDTALGGAGLGDFSLDGLVSLQGAGNLPCGVDACDFGVLKGALPASDLGGLETHQELLSGTEPCRELSTPFDPYGPDGQKLREGQACSNTGCTYVDGVGCTRSPPS